VWLPRRAGIGSGLPLSSQILSVTGQQIECKEARLATPEQQILELRMSAFIEADDLAIHNSILNVRHGRGDCVRYARER